MNAKEICGQILNRDIYLYGDIECVGNVIKRYRGLLRIAKVVTDYSEEVAAKPFADQGLETILFDGLDADIDVLFVICDPRNFNLRRRRLELIRKAEYTDYFSYELLETLVCHRQLLLCMGTSLIRQVTEALGTSREIAEAYSVVYFAEDELMEPYANRMTEYIHVSKCCDVYLCSSCEKERYPLNRLKRGTLPESCRYITISDYGFFGYFPTIVPDREYISDYFMREYKRKNMEYGTLFAAREDAELLRLCKERRNVEDIMEKLLDQELLEHDAICSHFEKELRRWEQLEQDDTIPLSSFIRENRTECLCRNLDEWSGYAVRYVTNEVLKQLGISAPVDSVDSLIEETSGTELPIYPCVREALQLKDEEPDRRYKIVTFQSTKYLSLKEYLEYLIVYNQKAIDLLEFTGMSQRLNEK